MYDDSLESLTIPKSKSWFFLNSLCSIQIRAILKLNAKKMYSWCQMQLLHRHKICKIVRLEVLIIFVVLNIFCCWFCKNYHHIISIITNVHSRKSLIMTLNFFCYTWFGYNQIYFFLHVDEAKRRDLIYVLNDKE